MLPITKREQDSFSIWIVQHTVQGSFTPQCLDKSDYVPHNISSDWTPRGGPSSNPMSFYVIIVICFNQTKRL